MTTMLVSTEDFDARAVRDSFADAPVRTGSSVTDLADQIVSFAGRLASSMCRWLLLIAEFDAAAGHEAYGMSGTASWLGHWCGLSRRTAAEHVRVARVLAREPTLAGAMGEGRLSYSQVRAISRIAEPGGHELVNMLINVAENGTVAQLESVIAGLRTVDDHDPTRTATLPREYVRAAYDEGSHWRMSARMAPEDGALVEAALAQIARSLPTDAAEPSAAGDAGTTGADITAEAAGARPLQVRALIRLAELGLAALAEERLAGEQLAGEQLAGEQKDNPRRDRRAPEQAAVVVHVDADRLAGSGSQRADNPSRPGGRLQHGPGLPDRVVERLLCDGRIRTVLERRGSDGRRTPLDLGRGRRVVSPKLFLALLIRDEGCRRPGCGATDNLHAHHVRHWLYGGQTNLDNMILLCARHHREHHEGQLSIERVGPGQFRMRFLGRELPDGPALARIVRRPGQCAPEHRLEDEHPHVEAAAARGRWAGDKLDRRYAVAVAASIRALERGDAVA